MIYNRLFHNRFLREEAIPGSEGEGPGGGAPPPASPVDSPPPADPPVPSNPYDFSGGAEQSDPDPGSPPPLSPQEETEYEIDFGEGFVENDALRDMLKGHARAAGLPADAAGKFLSEVAASIRADEEEAFKEADEALKDEWGAEYETNVSAAKAFARKLSVESGVSMEKMAVFASPGGFRVLHAISRMTGEGGLKGGGQIPAKTDPADEAQAILSDPNHRYYKAIADPSHPQWREATDYYNKLVGISG
ncbi:hypothetical protein [uncultured Akkermansia sp.]|uniref:hypothetical protein n=1 Tax=uncultured Akkermansia sp. TaxID=512294 RepID=UPI00260FE98D|nr:hypothetical protein [uncultured Akkermansia sp.]